ncbi:MAG: hypothetical protein HBSIN02_11770 [Bacteroidia bacterium]|nr:MAG: hypothetical protein HBSIN02_11770 [Bacteroidia bacterium]
MINFKTLGVFFTASLLVSVSTAQVRTVEGRGEEYHHAMYLNFRHAADQAQALFTQVSLPRPLLMEIAREHIEEVMMNLERARIQHAMIHKTYGSNENQLILENHERLLKAHVAAIEHAKQLKAELERPSPDKEVVKSLAAKLYTATATAAHEHADGMKKLGLQEMQLPS